jgi:hypothetical protein
MRPLALACAVLGAAQAAQAEPSLGLDFIGSVSHVVQAQVEVKGGRPALSLNSLWGASAAPTATTAATATTATTDTTTAERASEIDGRPALSLPVVRGRSPTLSLRGVATARAVAPARPALSVTSLMPAPTPAPIPTPAPKPVHVPAIGSKEFVKILASTEFSKNPAQFALALVQAGKSSLSGSDVQKCDRLAAGDVHCEMCVLPVVNMLLQRLRDLLRDATAGNAVKMSQAHQMCTSLTPGKRPGGVKKCCARKLAKREWGASHAYRVCAAVTIQQIQNLSTVTKRDLKLNDDDGYKWTGNRHSRGVLDCCDENSVCSQAEYRYEKSLGEKMVEMNTKKMTCDSYKDKKRASIIEQSNAQIHWQEKQAAINKICLTVNHTTPATPLDCTAGAVKTLVTTSESAAGKAAHDRTAINSALKVVGKAHRWLTGKARGTISGPAPMSLVMAAHPEALGRGTGCAVAVNALQQVNGLLRSSDTSMHAQEKLAHLERVLAKKASEMDLYLQRVTTHAKQQIDNMMDTVTTRLDERETYYQRVLQEMANEKRYSERVAFYMSSIDSMADSWIDDWRLREQNVQKCQRYQTHFDGKEVTANIKRITISYALQALGEIKCTQPAAH